MQQKSTISAVGHQRSAFLVRRKPSSCPTCHGGNSSNTSDCYRHGRSTRGCRGRGRTVPMRTLWLAAAWIVAFSIPLVPDAGAGAGARAAAAFRPQHHHHHHHQQQSRYFHFGRRRRRHQHSSNDNDSALLFDRAAPALAVSSASLLAPPCWHLELVHEQPLAACARVPPPPKRLSCDLSLTRPPAVVSISPNPRIEPSSATATATATTAAGGGILSERPLSSSSSSPTTVGAQQAQQQQQHEHVVAVTDESDVYQCRKEEWAAKYTSLQGLRDAFGHNRNEFWGDLDSETARRLYKTLLPRSLLELYKFGVTAADLAPLAYAARKAAKLYVRYRSRVHARVISNLFDGYRQWRKYGSFQMRGMSYQQIWEKYTKVVLAEESTKDEHGSSYEETVNKICLKILERSCETNAMVDRLCLNNNDNSNDNSDRDNSKRRQRRRKRSQEDMDDLQQITDQLERDVRQLLRPVNDQEAEEEEDEEEEFDFEQVLAVTSPSSPAAAAGPSSSVASTATTATTSSVSSSSGSSNSRRQRYSSSHQKKRISGLRVLKTLVRVKKRLEHSSAITTNDEEEYTTHEQEHYNHDQTSESSSSSWHVEYDDDDNNNHRNRRNHHRQHNNVQAEGHNDDDVSPTAAAAAVAVVGVVRPTFTLVRPATPVKTRVEDHDPVSILPTNATVSSVPDDADYCRRAARPPPAFVSKSSIINSGGGDRHRGGFAA